MKITKAITITLITAACMPLALQAQRQGQGQGRPQGCTYQNCPKQERLHKNCRASYNNGLHDNCPLSCPRKQQSNSRRSR